MVVIIGFVDRDHIFHRDNHQTLKNQQFISDFEYCVFSKYWGIASLFGWVFVSELLVISHICMNNHFREKAISDQILVATEVMC